MLIMSSLHQREEKDVTLKCSNVIVSEMSHLKMRKVASALTCNFNSMINPAMVLSTAPGVEIATSLPMSVQLDSFVSAPQLN